MTAVGWAFGVFTHPNTSRRTYADPKQRRAFAEAMLRRSVKLGEVKP